MVVDQKKNARKKLSILFLCCCNDDGDDDTTHDTPHDARRTTRIVGEAVVGSSTINMFTRN